MDRIAEHSVSSHARPSLSGVRGTDGVTLARTSEGGASGGSGDEPPLQVDEYEQEREEVARYQRYTDSLRMYSGEAQGFGFTELPDVADAHTSQQPVPAPGPIAATDADYSGGQEQSGDNDGSDADSELEEMTRLGLVPAGGAVLVDGTAVQPGATANAVQSPFQAAAGQVPGNHVGGGGWGGVAAGGEHGSTDRQTSGSLINQTLRQRPSLQLGKPLARHSQQAAAAGTPAAGSTATSRMPSQSMVRQRSGSVRAGTVGLGGGAGGGVAHGGGAHVLGSKEHNDLLEPLSPEHRMLLRFVDVTSWVEKGPGGGPGGATPAGGDKSTGDAGSGSRGLMKRMQEGVAHQITGFTAPPVRALNSALNKSMRVANASLRRALAAPSHLVGSTAPSTTGGKAGHSIQEGDVEAGLGQKGWHVAGGQQPLGNVSLIPPGSKTILHGITGEVQPGQVLALMGPSGSGKTSLLSIIGGRAPRRVGLAGQVTVNGQRLTKAARRRIGFVLQDDVLYETLTVKETLTYAGVLRLPRTMSHAEKMARVDAVMAVLGLTRSKDTIIGGYFRRGVSGGERKRVSVGHELLINPAVLMLDEPTSGLDSTTALHLVTLLRELASGGRAVLTTIHQPSSRLYRNLDLVMLLAEGHVMYYGAANLAADWFTHLGFPLPYGTNLADHILDCAMGEAAWDADAPGVVNVVAAECATAAKGAEGAEHCQPIKHLKGPAAVRSLYHTFEGWYRAHPHGFITQHVDHSSATAAGGRGVGGDGEEGAGSSKAAAAAAAAVDGLLSSVRLVPPRRSLLPAAGAHSVAPSAALSKQPPQVPGPGLGLGRAGNGAAGGAGAGAGVGGVARVDQEPAGESHSTSREQPLNKTPVASGLTDVQAHQTPHNLSEHPGGSLTGRDLLSVLQHEAGVGGASTTGGTQGTTLSSSTGGGGTARTSTAASDASTAEVGSTHLQKVSGGHAGAGAEAGGGTGAGMALAAPHTTLHLDGVSEGGAAGRQEFIAYSSPRDGAGFFEQITILWRRALKVRRFESLSGQNLAQLLGVALITGCLWWQKGAATDVSAGADILGLLFFELLFPSFRSLFSALFTFPNEFRMLSKERPSGMYRLSSYYIARTFADLPIEVLYPSIFIIIVYFFGGLRLAAGAFFSNWATMLLLVLVAQTWGLLIGGLFMDPKSAQTVTTVVMLTFLLVGGYYVRDVPVWIGWIKYISFVYWGNNLLIKIQFRGTTLRDCGQPGCPDVSDLQSALRLTVDPNAPVYPDVLVLLAMLIALRWATYMVLRWKTAASTRGI